MTFGMIPLFALPVIRGMGVDSAMFYRFALSSAVVEPICCSGGDPAR